MSKQAVQTRILFRRKTQEPSGREKMEKRYFEIPARIFWFSSFKKQNQNEKIQEIAFRNRFSGAKVKEKEERLTC